MNNTGRWYTVLAGILVSGFIIQMLADKGVIASPRPLLAGVIASFAFWLIGYGALSFRRGVFDFFGPVLTFSRFRRPVLFVVLIVSEMAAAVGLLWGAVQMIQAAN